MRGINQEACTDVELCFFGLYAPANAELLRSLGAVAVIGGEFETELAGLVSDRRRRTPAPLVGLARQRFRVPDRSGLPGLERYAQLRMPDGAPDSPATPRPAGAAGTAAAIAR